MVSRRRPMDRSISPTARRARSGASSTPETNKLSSQLRLTPALLAVILRQARKRRSGQMRLFIRAFLVVVFTGSVLLAQTVSIGGVVRDPSGLAVPGSQ